MPPIMTNSKDGLGHNDKYLDTKEDLVTRNAHVQYEGSNIYYLEVMTNVNLKKRSKDLVPTKRSYHK